MTSHRWNRERIAEMILSDPDNTFSVKDLAREVYGEDTPLNRTKVVRHLSAQRTYMAARMSPLVFTFGERGIILSVKAYDPGKGHDRERLTQDLERQFTRSEISAEQLDTLKRVYGV